VKIGIDIDGVLSNFNRGFIDLIEKETGKTLPALDDTYPDEWNYHKRWVTPEQDKKIWAEIRTSMFWFELEPYAQTPITLVRLRELRAQGHEIYFITTRPGELAKLDTEQWLKKWGMSNPTVLIAGNEKAKGQLAAGLGLDAFIDDKPENCEQVVAATRILHGEDAQGGFLINHVEYPCQVFLVDQPYNREFGSPHIVRIGSALEALNLLMESSVVAKAA
jgi:uncharacterized HAD superfamily protein